MARPNANNYKLHFATPCEDLSPIQASSCQGEKVNADTSDRQSPLMLAVLHNDPFAMDSLLCAGADIDITDNGALQMAFSLKATDSAILRKFLRIVRNRYRDNDELAEKLFESGCQLYHASFLRDVQVTRGLLARGVRDVDWAGYKDMTALHVAAMSNHLPLISCLFDAGANANALDAHGRGALFIAAAHGNAKAVRLFLERGANPNARAFGSDAITPFDVSLAQDSRGSNECAELLLLHGAAPTQRIGDHRPKLLDETLGSCRKTNLLISYAALRESHGDSAIAETVMECDLDDCRANLSEYRKRYQHCQRVLKMRVFEGLTLLELLSASAAKFQSYMRRESFYETMTRFQMDMDGYGVNSNPCVYYYKALKHFMDKALPRFLEDTAILAISRLVGGSFDQCYVFGRRVVEYLSRRDVHRLIEVFPLSGGSHRQPNMKKN